MANRIFLKNGGLTGQVPKGYKAFGFNLQTSELSFKGLTSTQPVDSYLISATLSGTNLIFNSSGNGFTGTVSLPLVSSNNDTYLNIGSSSISSTIDWSLATTQEVILDNNPTFTFTNPSLNKTYTLLLRQDRARTLTWPSNIVWKNLTTPTGNTTFVKNDDSFTINTGSNFDSLKYSGGYISSGGKYTDMSVRISSFTTSNISDKYCSSESPDGSIFVGFTSGIRKLNSNGTVSSDSFNTGIGTGPNNRVKTIDIESNGKILCGGIFTTFNSATASGRSYLTRLNPDGTRDTSIGGFDNYVNTVIVQPDGKILVAGAFTLYFPDENILSNTFIPLLTSNTSNGTASSGNSSSFAFRAFDKNLGTSWTSTTGLGTTAWVGYQLTTPKTAKRYYILKPFSATTNRPTGWNFQGSNDGTSWTTLETVTGDTNISYLSPVLSNTTPYSYYRVLVNTVQSGSSAQIIELEITEDTSVNVVAANRIIRLNSDGTVDGTFNSGTGFNGAIGTSGTPTRTNTSMVLLNDGKILLVGEFSSYNGTTANRVIRLNSNGSVDNTFDSGSGISGSVVSIYAQSDGKYLFSGGFSSYNGISRNRIVRTNNNGSIDTTFSIGTGLNNVAAWSISPSGFGTIDSIFIQSDNKILISGDCAFYNGRNVIPGSTTGPIRLIREDLYLKLKLTWDGTNYIGYYEN